MREVKIHTRPLVRSFDFDFDFDFGPAESLQPERIGMGR